MEEQEVLEQRHIHAFEAWSMYLVAVGISKVSKSGSTCDFCSNGNSRTRERIYESARVIPVGFRVDLSWAGLSRRHRTRSGRCAPPHKRVADRDCPERSNSCCRVKAISVCGGDREWYPRLRGECETRVPSTNKSILKFRRIRKSVVNTEGKLIVPVECETMANIERRICCVIFKGHERAIGSRCTASVDHALANTDRMSVSIVRAKSKFSGLLA